eukprot:TRINITY_DN95138_c0_g1_i1.p1 TRINITY_DN95138_c0_g1~~TRINITY_DN95138_c0_g1_i1.p1  ORF type:complete len:290 (+),score=74.44 TRINITY_DN95138_c0_g1_i1:55-870(+)
MAVRAKLAATLLASAVLTSSSCSAALSALSAAALLARPAHARGDAVPLAALWNGPEPTAQELGRRSTEELMALLQSKRLTCSGCSDKASVVQKVLETWDVGLLEVASPDGKVLLTKDDYVQNLKQSYKRKLKRKAEEGGHELADDEDSEEEDDGIDPRQLPDFEQVWAEFSAKIAKGDVPTDSTGQISYDMAQAAAPPSFFDRWKSTGLICLNISMFACTQYLKRSKPSEPSRESRADTSQPSEDCSENFENEGSSNKKHVKKKKDGKKRS